MRNLAEQKRVFDAVLFTELMWGLYALLIVLFFLFNLIPAANSIGFSLLPYSSESIGAYSKGDLVLYIKNTAAPEGKLFSYISEGTDAKGKTIKIIHTALYIDSYETEGGTEENGSAATIKTIYVLQTSDGAMSYVSSDEATVIGWSSFRIPYIGYAAIYLNYSLLISILSLIVLTLLMVPLPVLLIVKRRRLNRLPTPFPEGIDARDLNKENYYIITELRHFFKKGKFLFIKGHDCFKVYIPSMPKRRLFATIMQVNKHIQVLIHTDLKRADGRIDRSNFINIFNAAELPDVKKTIVRLYREHFKPKQSRTFY